MGASYLLSDVERVERARRTRVVKKSSSLTEQPRTRRNRNISSDSDLSALFSSSPKECCAIDIVNMYQSRENASVIEEGEISSRMVAMRVRNRVDMDGGAMQIPTFSGTQVVTEFFKKFEIVGFAKELTQEQMARCI